MTTQLIINAAQASDKGVKPSNEDCAGVRVPDSPLRESKGIAAVIADGMSGSEGGQEASQVCVQGFLTDYFATPESWTVKTSGQKVLGALNRWLHGRGWSQHGSETGMVTTFSTIIIKSNTAYLFHVGDTRIYRYRGKDLECLTHDHRIVINSEKNYLSRAMGIDIHVDIDYQTCAVEQGDIFLLTTDGVHEFVDHHALAKHLNDTKADPQICCDQIIAAALENASNDNVSCLLLQVAQLPNYEEQEFFRYLTELPFPPPLEPGMILDGYRVLREMHASNRTQIYLALDTETQQKVVIKTPSVNFDDDPGYIDRFLHEEWVGLRLHSQHILKVVKSNRPKQFLYYVTEYVQGRSLRQWMHDQIDISLDQVRNTIEQIAAGLRAFHRLEMVHQDLKPENILIDASGVVKIIDFGSTKILGIEENSVPINREDWLGTIDYSAPEFFREEPGSKLSDIYSLGAICYELLTGKLPYGQPFSENNINRLHYIPTHHFNRRVPQWMDMAIQKAVNKDTRRRYEILSEFVYDLSHPNPDLTAKQTVPLMQRNPLMFWKGLSFVLFLVNIALFLLLVY